MGGNTDLLEVCCSCPTKWFFLACNYKAIAKSVPDLNAHFLQEQPRFTIDHEANTFMLDGQPFRYVSGSFHYFRAVPESWRSRLRTMRASGLNALDT